MHMYVRFTFLAVQKSSVIISNEVNFLIGRV